MKKIIFILSCFLIFGCSSSNKTYWCGDHPCINKKEREAYFKETMIVEIKEIKNNSRKISNVEKIIEQNMGKEKKDSDYKIT